jgi:hypothetical protein
MAKYEIMVDGRRQWRADTEKGVARWLAEYRQAHAEDDPDWTHVQVLERSPLSWLTGGKLVDHTQFLPG